MDVSHQKQMLQWAGDCQKEFIKVDQVGAENEEIIPVEYLGQASQFMIMIQAMI